VLSRSGARTILTFMFQLLTSFSCQGCEKEDHVWDRGLGLTKTLSYTRRAVGSDTAILTCYTQAHIQVHKVLSCRSAQLKLPWGYLVLFSALPPVIRGLQQFSIRKAVIIPSYRERRYNNTLPVAVAELSKACTVFTRSGRNRGYESHSGHGCLMCVCVFLCLCCPVFR
jgi:hypothetical protein